MKLPIPPASLAQHIILLGKTRSGKSSKARVLVEYLLEEEKPITIIDPKGDWWGIRSNADGERRGYPVVIFGGEHADVPLNERNGAAIAELIATGNRPALIDLGGWMVSERTRFFIDFASTFFKLARGERVLMIDEVHNFAPKGKVLSPDAGKCLHWANRLASEGAGKGITLIAASQRPQKVHNDLLTSCETLIACKVIHKADRVAIKDWIDGCADLEIGKQVLESLAQLKKPEAWVWSPEIEFGPERVAWPLFRTFDSFKPQGARHRALKGWADVDLADVRTKLDSSIKEAEANDPVRLRARIVELQRELAKPKEMAIDTHALEQAETSGFERGIAGVREVISEMRRRSAEITSGVQTALDMMLTDAQKQAKPLKSAPERRIDGRAGGSLRSRMPVRPPRMRIGDPVLMTGGKELRIVATNVSSDLPKGEATILNALIQFPTGRTRSQLMVLTQYATRSLATYLPRLMERGYVEKSGGLLRATNAGRHAMPEVSPLPQGQALQDHWREILPEGERRIFEELVKARGEPLTREHVQVATNYATRSIATYVPRLVAKGIVIATRGELRASADLF